MSWLAIPILARAHAGCHVPGRTTWVYSIFVFWIFKEREPMLQVEAGNVSSQRMVES